MKQRLLILAVTLLAALLILTACAIPSEQPPEQNAGETTTGNDNHDANTSETQNSITGTIQGTGKPSETTALLPFETLPTPSDSLTSADAVREIGVKCGDTVVEAFAFGVGGYGYYKNENGETFQVIVDGTSILHPTQIKNDCPVITVKSFSEIEVIDHVTDKTAIATPVYYRLNGNYDPSITQTAKPTEEGVYLMAIEVTYPSYSEESPAPSRETKTGSYRYWCVVIYTGE